jgi:uncharacterized protein involved in outer membrane biogenesis
MKKPWMIGGGVVLAILLLLLVIPMFLDINQFRGQIQTKASAALHRPVTLGPMSLSLLPPTIDAKQLVIGEDAAFATGRPFAKADELKVSVGLFALLGGKVSVESVELKKPALELVRNAHGVWNYSTLTSSSDKSSGGSSSDFSLDKLRITDATIGVTDLAAGTPRREFDHVDIGLDHFRMDQPFGLTLAAQLPGGVPVKLEGQVHYDEPHSAIHLIETKLKLAGSSLNIAGGVDLKPATPALQNVHLWASDFAAEDAIKTANALGIELAPGMKIAGKVSTDVTANGPASLPQMNGKVSVKSLEASGNGLAEPVKISSLEIALTPEQARSNDFQVTSGNTTLNTRFTLNQYASASPAIDAVINTPGAALNNLLGIARAYGVKGLEGLSGDGTLALDMRAAGPVSRLTGNSVLQTVNGRATLNFSNVKVPGIDLNEAVNSITKLSGGGARKGYTALSKVTGNIQVAQGVAQSNDLNATFDMGSVSAAGTANLVSQALNMNVLAKLNAQFSSAAGAVGAAGGLINSALGGGSSSGGLEVPIIVTGTFSNPHYAPDLQKMAKSKLNNALGGGAKGLLGGVTGQQGNPQANDLGNALGGLFGKKKKK